MESSSELVCGDVLAHRPDDGGVLGFSLELFHGVDQPVNSVIERGEESTQHLLAG